MQTILFLVLLLAFSAYGLPLEKDQDFDPFDSLYDPFSVGFANVANYDWIFQTIQKLEQEMKAKKKAKEMVLNNTPGLTIPRPFTAFFSGWWIKSQVAAAVTMCIYHVLQECCIYCSKCQ